MASSGDDCQKLPPSGADVPSESSSNRRAISSGEPSSDGSIDEERSALSDSDLPDALRVRTIATQAKGPSSDALEAECRAQQNTDLWSSDEETTEEADATEWKDVVGSGQLLYKVLHRTDGLKPRNGQEVTIRVEDKTFGVDSLEQTTFVLGFSMVIDAWELVTSSIHEGEIVLVKGNSRFAYGSVGDVERGIPPDQDMEYEIELLKVGEGVTYSNLERTDLLQRILQLKERGNYYYSRKELEKAIFVYKRCVDLVEIPKDDEEIRNLFSLVFSNLAVCYTKLGDWKATLSAADEALQLNAKSKKALFRRANAYASMNLVDKAIETLQTAGSIDPNDALVVQELHRMKALQRKHLKQERSLYKRMLAGMHLEDPSSPRFAVRFRHLIPVIAIVVVAVFFHFVNLFVRSYFSRSRT